MALLTVGEFSRITHLTVKTLRHYHDVGLLEPAEVDPATSYRYYAPAQIPQAQVIRRLRDLEMPVPDVKAVLAAHDAGARNALIAKHLARLEQQLERTRASVESLRSLVERPRAAYPVSHRTVPAVRALAIRAVVEHADIAVWWRGAIGELGATVRAQRIARVGPIGGLYDAELYESECGHALMFAPIGDAPAKPVGRVELATVPAAELAIVTHTGPEDDIDLAYGELGAYVATHEIGVAGPIREHYVRGLDDGAAPRDRVTEIAWPIFRSDR